MKLKTTRTIVNTFEHEPPKNFTDGTGLKAGASLYVQRQSRDKQRRRNKYLPNALKCNRKKKHNEEYHRWCTIKARMDKECWKPKGTFELNKCR